MDQPTFSENEACLLCDALNGVRAMPETLKANVSVAISMDHLDSKWGVDAPTLLARLDNLDENQAIIHAVARAWGVAYHVPDLRKRVRDVGLVAEEKKEA